MMCKIHNTYSKNQYLVKYRNAGSTWFRPSPSNNITQHTNPLFKQSPPNNVKSIFVTQFHSTNITWYIIYTVILLQQHNPRNNHFTTTYIAYALNKQHPHNENTLLWPVSVFRIRVRLMPVFRFYILKIQFLLKKRSRLLLLTHQLENIF